MKTVNPWLICVLGVTLWNPVWAYYDPNEGRFLSPDPGGNAASLNLYDYADGDTVNRLDPDGRYVRPLLELADRYQIRTRAMGTLQLAGGIGLGAMGAPMIGTPAAPLGAVLIGLGIDQAQTGLRSALYGQPYDSLLYQGGKALGMSDREAMLMEFGMTLGSPARSLSSMWRFEEAIELDAKLSMVLTDVNPERIGFGRSGKNCLYVSLFADGSLAGYPSSALPVIGRSFLGELTEIYGRPYRILEDNPAAIESYFSEHNPGSRFIGLFGFQGNMGHAINIYLDAAGKPVFIDAQVGQRWSRWSDVRSAMGNEVDMTGVIPTHQGGGSEIWDDPLFHDRIGQTILRYDELRSDPSAALPEIGF